MMLYITNFFSTIYTIPGVELKEEYYSDKRDKQLREVIDNLKGIDQYTMMVKKSIEQIAKDSFAYKLQVRVYTSVPINEHSAMLDDSTIANYELLILV